MVSQRFRSISSVFGGKNSKEIAGAGSARAPSRAGGVSSVMEPITPVVGLPGLGPPARSPTIGERNYRQQPTGDGKLPNIGQYGLILPQVRARNWADNREDM